jgi:hypothetical protein
MVGDFKRVLFNVVSIALFASSLHSQWSTDPNNNLIVGYGLLPEICSDSAGGAYITYENNIIYPRQIELRRLNRYGYQPWGNSRLIRGIQPESRYASLTTDERGGVIVAYLDRLWNEYPPDPRYNDRVRVQRVDSNGNLLWGGNGVRVTIDDHRQSEDSAPAIVSDGVGGCVVAWVDSLGLLRVQRIGGGGTRAWGDSGKVVASSASAVRLIRSDERHCIVSFGRLLKRFTVDGVIAWNDSAVNAGFSFSNIESDDNGGVILGGKSGTAQNIMIVTQRIDSTGQKLWIQPYVVLTESAGINGGGIPVARNQDGGGTFAWVKIINGRNRAFTQRVRSNGTLAFPSGPIQVSAYDSAANGTWSILSSCSDTKIFVNADSRNGASLFAQRMDSTGTRLWNTNDVAVSLLDLGYVKITTDGNFGGVVIGFDQSDFSVRAQQFSVHGNLGEILTSVVENDNGPTTFELLQNYPNPFNNSTRIVYSVPTSAPIEIRVFSILGQHVQTLVRHFEDVGLHKVDLDARDLPSGVYFIELKTPYKTQVRKALLLK